MCAQKLADASLIYCTEPKTKTRKNEKTKLAIRSVERGICPIAGVKYDVTIVLLDNNFL